MPGLGKKYQEFLKKSVNQPRWSQVSTFLWAFWGLWADPWVPGRGPEKFENFEKKIFFGSKNQKFFMVRYDHIRLLGMFFECFQCLDRVHWPGNVVMVSWRPKIDENGKKIAFLTKK